MVADEGDLDGREDSLCQCQSLGDWDSSTAWVRATGKHPGIIPDDVLQSRFFCPIYSPRLRAGLETAGIGGIQYFPIRVFRPDSIELSGFCVANILNCVDALDLQKSEIRRFPNDYFLPASRGKIQMVNEATLLAAALEPFDIVRLAGYSSMIYVSQRFVRVFEDNQFSGYSFKIVALSGTR
jgi:hypothetical protein